MVIIEKRHIMTIVTIIKVAMMINFFKFNS